MEALTWIYGKTPRAKQQLGLRPIERIGKTGSVVEIGEGKIAYIVVEKPC